jgi:hypothetical protein
LGLEKKRFEEDDGMVLQLSKEQRNEREMNNCLYVRCETKSKYIVTKTIAFNNQWISVIVKQTWWDRLGLFQTMARLIETFCLTNFCKWLG